jgi:hypothetical protein
VANLHIIDRRPCSWREGAGLGTKHSQVGRRIAADHLRHSRLVAGQAHANVLIALDHVMGGDEDPVRRPDDPGGRQAMATLQPDHERAGSLHRRGQGRR